MKCTQCGSEKLTLNLPVRERLNNYPLVVQTLDNPEATFFKGSRSYEVHGNVCADCGYLMLTLPQSDATEIYETHMKR